MPQKPRPHLSTESSRSLWMLVLLIPWDEAYHQLIWRPKLRLVRLCPCARPKLQSGRSRADFSRADSGVGPH
jgi:hypothetical protein